MAAENSHPGLVTHAWNSVTSITLKGCKSIKMLTPLGKLPLLKKLKISKLDALSRIGVEFYGTEKPFRSLLSLSFHDMPTWEEWSSPGDYRDNEQAFPCLRELMMQDCPLLKSGLPGRLDALSQLIIRGCPLLETAGDSLSLPTLRDTYIAGCNVLLLKCLVDVTSMTQMRISEVPEFIYFDRRFSTSWVSLEKIWIISCPHFESFVDGHFVKQVLPKLTFLEIDGCDNLEKLPDDLYCLPSMNVLWVSSCRKLSAFPSAGLPPTLIMLRVSGCPALPMSQFLGTRLPKALEVLDLDDLEGLTSLKDLILGGHCSRSLRRLSIRRCTSLTTVPDCLLHLSSLSELWVQDCPALELDRFPDLPCSLSTFELVGCPKVTSLPHNTPNLTSLKVLEVKKCAGITCFPRGGFPPSLESLIVYNCKKLNQPLEEWCLSGLGDLREFSFGGSMECMDEMACFPSADGSHAWRGALPSSLVRLYILGMKKAERLAGGLRTSLRELQIIGCEKMRFLPDEGFPDSLEEIEIRGCPLLEERCREEDKGEYWPLLQLIPLVDIE